MLLLQSIIGSLPQGAGRSFIVSVPLFLCTPVPWMVCRSGSAGFWGCDISMSQKVRRNFKNILLTLLVHICDHQKYTISKLSPGLLCFLKITFGLNFVWQKGLLFFFFFSFSFFFLLFFMIRKVSVQIQRLLQ